MRHQKSKRKFGVFAKNQISERRRPPRLAAMVIFAITGALLSSIALAAWTVVPEVSRAPGEILPNDNFRQIEALEGGRVEQVMAREGDQVTKGQVLAVLSSVEIAREINQLRQETATLDIWAKNHHTILAALGDNSGTAPASPTDPADLHYADSTLEVYRAQQQIDHQVIERLRENLRLQNSALNRLTTRRAEKSAVANNQESLLSRGLTTRAAVESAKDALADTVDQIHNLELRNAETHKEIALLEAKLVQTTLSLREKHVEARFQTEQSRRSLQAAIDAAEARRDALRIVAPETGTIQSVGFPNAGEVIGPGETLFELLPASEQAVAMVRIAPRDIGHIFVGMSVQLQFETYDARRFQPVSGTIESISPNRVINPENGEEYFRTRVKLNEDVVGSGGFATKPIIAGMTVTSEIVTRERTMLAYLLKPIERSFQTAFGER